jgi:hypothetical protein
VTKKVIIFVAVKSFGKFCSLPLSSLAASTPSQDDSTLNTTLFNWAMLHALIPFFDFWNKRNAIDCLTYLQVSDDYLFFINEKYTR